MDADTYPGTPPAIASVTVEEIHSEHLARVEAKLDTLIQSINSIGELQQWMVDTIAQFSASVEQMTKGGGMAKMLGGLLGGGR